MKDLLYLNKKALNNKISIISQIKSMQTQTIFWQGTRQVLITSGLNHVAHKIDEMIEEATIQKYVRQAGYDPCGVPEQTVEYANTMLEKVALLKANKTLSGGRARIKGIINDSDVHGRTIAKLERYIY